MKRFSIVKNFIYFLGISLALIFGSLYMFITNLKWSIEFTGGIKIVVAGEKKIDIKDFENHFKQIKPAIKTTFTNEKNTYIEFRSLDTSVKYDNELLGKVKQYLKEKKYITSPKDFVSISFVGPTIGEYMKETAKTALIWGVSIMAIYVFFAFVGVREHFAPWIFSLITLLTLLHDVIMAAGGYGVWMGLNPSVVVDSVFVMAILTVLGYSVNDTIIIFDRIRENLIKYAEQIRGGSKKLYEVFDESLYQVMRRSLLTSFSTLLVVACMYYFGNSILKDFSFVIFVGVLFGTYSSIFLAAPGAYWLNKLITKKE